MYSDWWRLAYYDKQQQISVWDKLKTQTRTLKPENVPTSQILYDPVSWTSITPKKYCANLQDEKLMKLYLNYRQERWARHKDNVTAQWEKRMLNIINKYPKSVICELLKFTASEWYKGIVEDKKMIEELMVWYKKELKKIEDEKEKEENKKQKKEAISSTEKRNQRILASWKTKEYWVQSAKNHIRKDRPEMSDEHMKYLIPNAINQLLDKYDL